MLVVFVCWFYTQTLLTNSHHPWTLQGRRSRWRAPCSQSGQRTPNPSLAFSWQIIQTHTHIYIYNYVYIYIYVYLCEYMSWWKIIGISWFINLAMLGFAFAVFFNCSLSCTACHGLSMPEGSPSSRPSVQLHDAPLRVSRTLGLRTARNFDVGWFSMLVDMHVK